MARFLIGVAVAVVAQRIYDRYSPESWQNIAYMALEEIRRLREHLSAAGGMVS